MSELKDELLAVADLTVRFVPTKKESDPPPYPTGERFDGNNSTFKPSREAAGVWITAAKPRSVWKIYRKTNTLDTLKKDIKTAEDNDLPLVPIEKINVGGQQEKVPTGFVFLPVDSPLKTFGFAIKTRFLENPYVFFSAQTGGVAIFRNFLKDIEIKSHLERYKGSLEIALKIKLSDPQGFINPSGEMQFLDIHIGGNATGVQSLLEAVNDRLAQLALSLAEGLVVELLDGEDISPATSEVQGGEEPERRE
ncbi:hypothetical protein HWV62_22245 [Athelia sp. TMB]|nr:hypothetical protein HWV62_22245 [Athelia sp. TMB]